MQSTKQLFGKLGKPALAVLLAVSVLWLNALVAAPGLHADCHHDADQASHACVVTLFAKGQVDTASCDVPVSAPDAGIETATSHLISVSSTVFEILPPGRAPPARLASPV